MKKNILLAFVMLALVFSAWSPSPAAAATDGTQGKKPVSLNSTLTINSKADAVILVYLEGPKGYTIVAAPGKTVKEILKGTYRYTYTACGAKKSGSLKVKGSTAKLNLPACPTARITLINQGATNLTVYLSGPKNYTLQVPAKSNLKVKVLVGKYDFIANWCGGSENGNITAGKANYRWTFRCFE